MCLRSFYLQGGFVFVFLQVVFSFCCEGFFFFCKVLKNRDIFCFANGSFFCKRFCFCLIQVFFFKWFFLFACFSFERVLLVFLQGFSFLFAKGFVSFCHFFRNGLSSLFFL